MEWSNQPSALAALNLVIPRDQDFLVQWKNGNDPDLVIITGFSLKTDFSGAEFICTERASKGSFKRTAYVLVPNARHASLAATLAGVVGLVGWDHLGKPAGLAPITDLGYVTFSTTLRISIGGWR